MSSARRRRTVAFFPMDLHYFLGKEPMEGLMVILNLVLIESVLSIDNAAVLATMVMKLPEQQRGKALKYGIIGAYVFRGICLMLVGYLMNIWWLEPIGGAYLLWLAIGHFRKKESVEADANEAVATEGNWLYRQTTGRIGPFWATVIAVEVMDLAFSLDNVIAAVGFVGNEEKFPYPSNIYLVCVGVFIGILAMRFAAQGFVKLLHRYPFLESCAFGVIGLLGVKLVLGAIKHLMKGSDLAKFFSSHGFDFAVSIATLAIFVVPVVTHHLLGWPGRKGRDTDSDSDSDSDGEATPAV